MKKGIVAPILLATLLLGGYFLFPNAKDKDDVANVAATIESELPVEEEKVDVEVSRPATVTATSPPAQETIRTEKEIQTKSITTETVAGPKRLRIPSIGIDAHVEQVGLTTSGNMDAPAGPDNAGWYKYGVLPGEVGSAVIDGHSGWRDNIPAIFDNLPSIKVGDKIYVEGSDGTTTAFVVKDIKEYGYNDNAYEIFNSSDGLSHLNLITCAGEWNDIARSSLKRLVVFTDKVTN